MKLKKLHVKIIAVVVAFAMVLGIVTNGQINSKAGNTDIIGTELIQDNFDNLKDMSEDELNQIFNSKKYEKEFNKMLNNNVNKNVKRGGNHISQTQMNKILNDVNNHLPSSIKNIISTKGISLNELLSALVELYCSPNRDELVEDIVIFISDSFEIDRWTVKLIIDIIFYVMGFYITCPVTVTATATATTTATTAALATDMPTATVTTNTSNIKTMGDNTDASDCNLTLVNSNFDNLENGTEVAEITTDDGYKVIAKIVDNNVVFSKYNSENEIISSEKIALTAFDLENNIKEIPVRNEPNKWEKSVKEKYKENYWYRHGRDENSHLLNVGNSSVSKIIDMNELSPENTEKCNNYINAIDKCNRKMKEARAIKIGSAAVMSVVLIVIKACEIASGNDLSLISIISGIPGVTGGTALIKTFIEKILKVEECYSNVEESYIELLNFAK